MNTPETGTRLNSEQKHTSTPLSAAAKSHSKRKLKRKRRAAAFGLMLVLMVAVITWRMAHAQSPIGPPSMPLAYEFVPSPNFGERPINSPINFVVLHSTVIPTTEGTVSHFLTPASQVSAHFVVGRDGRIVQMVPIEKRAWHAGVSTWDGVKDINNVSVGIEMVNLNDGKDPYPEAQVQAVAGIIRFVRSRYTVPDDHIVSHAQIAIPQGRKSDPLGFDFDRIKTLAHVLPAPPLPTPLVPPVVNPVPPIPKVPAAADKTDPGNKP